MDGAVENIVAGGGAVTDVTYADKTITVKKGTNSATPLQLTGLVDGATDVLNHLHFISNLGCFIVQHRAYKSLKIR